MKDYLVWDLKTKPIPPHIIRKVRLKLQIAIDKLTVNVEVTNNTCMKHPNSKILINQKK
ncbi:hypothetical protein HanRHA438_Chr15g0730951 [Helianthus annuus]|nr:hypothetical protein HanRHA438_Chr15g0730951 [Helianthus annuus]